MPSLGVGTGWIAVRRGEEHSTRGISNGLWPGETSLGLEFQQSWVGKSGRKMEFQVGKGDASKNIEMREYVPFRAESSKN